MCTDKQVNVSSWGMKVFLLSFFLISFKKNYCLKKIYIYINIYVKLKFQILYVRFAQCNVVFLRLKYHTSENEVYYGNTETVFAVV